MSRLTADGEKIIVDGETVAPPPASLTRAYRERVYGFFGSQRPLRDSTTPPPSWRNTVTTALSFLVYIYALAIQIWIIVQ